MAFLGDFGKAFGLGSTGDVAAQVTAAFGGSTQLQESARRRGDEFAQVVGELGCYGT